MLCGVQAAFSAIDGVIANLPSYIGFELLLRIEAGLDDPEADIKMLSHQLLVHMASKPFWSAHILSRLARLSEVFRKRVGELTSKKGLGDGADVLRSTLRAIDAISQLEGASSVRE